MNHITAEGVDYFYFAPRDDISKLYTLSEEEPFWPAAFMKKYWNAFPYLRLVAEVHPRLKSVAVSWLYWGDDADLRTLDERVQHGTYTDADFAGSIRTQYSRHICFGCRREWHALIITPDQPHPALDIGRKKLETWWPRLKKCPACGSPQRQMVAKIFGEYGRTTEFDG